MEELLPSAHLVGMDDPLTWMRAVAAQLIVQPPCSPAQWLPPPADGAGLRWYELIGRELVTIYLFEKPGQVEIGIWTTSWDDDHVGYWDYRGLLTTVAALIIDQYDDQDGPLVGLQVQSYAETQAPLKELEE